MQFNIYDREITISDEALEGYKKSAGFTVDMELNDKWLMTVIGQVYFTTDKEKLEGYDISAIQDDVTRWLKKDAAQYGALGGGVFK